MLSAEPNVSLSKKYDDQIWTNNLSILAPIAYKGSACIQLLFYIKGIFKEEDIKFKLDESLLS